MPNNYVYKRGMKYTYRRRVPSHLSGVDPRREVVISLKTEDENEANIRASIYNDQVEAFWKALLQSNSQENFDEKYQTAVQLAKTHGFAYKTTDQIAASTLNEIVKRLSFDLSSDIQAEALLGGATRSSAKLTECFPIYLDLIQDRLTNKNKHKLRKWENPRKAAWNDFLMSAGDLFLDQVDRSVILQFRSSLNEKIKGGLSGDTVNKKLRFVKDVLKTVSIHHEINIDTGVLFADTKFQYNPGIRPSFEASWVQNKILPSLHELNKRDRYVIYAMADTGAREVEIFGLTPEDIKLDGEIPFIWIRPRKGYELKTRNSERQIPLVGSALEAFKQCPDGFSHAGNPDVFSNVANNYLKDKGLRPSPEHTVYSLRHTFKDRLRDYGDVGAPEEIIDELMGHRKPGIPYGRGHKLSAKYKILREIAYNV